MITFEVMRFWLLIVLTMGCFVAQSQITSYPFDSRDRAQILYLQRNYSNALSGWELQDKNENLGSTEEKSYRTLAAALRLNTPGTEKKLKTFLLEFPTSWYGVGIPLDLANFYFDNEKYSYALKWFGQVNERDIPRPKLPQFYFNKGYTQFLKKRYQSAKNLLEKVRSDPEYESDAHYYLGHIAYQLEDYDEASQSFGKVSNPSQKKDLGYFQVDMNFKLGRFEKAVSLGEAELEKSNSNLSELSKIVGESYFNLKEYDKALPYLLAYEGKKNKWFNTDYYQLGYTHYHLKNYEAAVAQFNKIVGKKDALSQNAYYFLGYCYVNIAKPTAARNAFRSASQMDFDSKVREDALFQYAKLSYELGNPYESPQLVLASFVDQFPDHPENALVEQLLVDSYTQLGNYKQAIELLNAGGTFKDNTSLQKVLFLQGHKSYRQGNYREAADYFEKASEKKESNEIALKALYWQAQSGYQFNDFAGALALFERFSQKKTAQNLKEWKALNYNRGYAHFKLKQYGAAIEAFEKQQRNVKLLSKELRHDLYLRLGDSYFANKQYWPAMETYNKAIALDPAKSSYAIFQKAISYGFVGRNNKKIETLKSLVNTQVRHNLVDDALFALASTLASESQSQNAVTEYARLIRSFPQSPYNSRALLNMGLIVYNQEQLEEATQILRRLVLNYPKSDVAQQGLNTLREIAVESGKVSDFSNWLRSNSIQSFSSNELEKSAFDAAEKKFLDNKKKQAEKLLVDYTLKYPEGTNSRAANFYLGEIYFEASDWENATLAYENVIESENEYTEKALVRSAIAFVNNEKKTKAIPLWQRLEKEANYEENKRYAMFNLMKTFYEQEEYALSLAQSEQVLQLSKIAIKVKWDALDVLAHSSLRLKDSLKAQKAFTQLENAPKDELAAEAFYFKAYIQYRQKAHEKSNETIALIAKKYSSAEKWSAKSLLLMARNFEQLEDSFQALFILESIEENFKNFPEIVKQAQTLKSQLEKKESDNS